MSGASISSRERSGLRFGLQQALLGRQEPPSPSTAIEPPSSTSGDLDDRIAQMLDEPAPGLLVAVVRVNCRPSR